MVEALIVITIGWNLSLMQGIIGNQGIPPVLKALLNLEAGKKESGEAL